MLIIEVQPMEARYIVNSSCINLTSPETNKRHRSHQISIGGERTAVEVATSRFPIYAACKRIRDVKGHWITLSQYIAAHSEVSLTHSEYTDCSRELYPRAGINRNITRRAGGAR